jgi:rhomboid protease GluP
LPLPYVWQMRVERLKKMFTFGKGERRPQLCPACGALVGISATRCHVCGANLRFGLAAWSKGLSEFFGGHAPVTTAILILNIIMFAAEILGSLHAGKGGISLLWGMDGETMYRLGASFPPAIFYGHEWFRLITASFLHGGLIHIGFNMLVLVDIGPMVEEVYGSARYLFLYLATGAAGYIVSAWAGNFSVGASASLLGIIGLLIAITTKRGGTQMKELRSRLISWVVTIFALGFLARGLRTDNWAHFGGFVAGFLLGRVFADRLPEPGPERTKAYALGWVAGIVLVVSFVMMVLHYADPIPGG